MSIQLSWLVSQSASCFHAVDALYRGRTLVDEKFAAAISEPAQLLLDDLEKAELPTASFLRNIVAYAAMLDSNRLLVERTLGIIANPNQYSAATVDQLIGRVTAVENLVRREFPNLVDDLALRAGPLREQWEARGPGLLAAIGKVTDPQLVVENSEVVLVHPVLGGGGSAHLINNTVRIEAMLVNPVPQLPEVLRLGWMFSQLNNDVPMFGEQVHRDRLPYIAAIAMVPVTLVAGEFVELTWYNAETIQLALQAWQVDVPPDEDVVGTIMAWWETYMETRPTWSVALQSLDRMIG